MSPSNQSNEHVVKKGWLTIQLPGTQAFKQYYALLRLSSLELYASPKEVPWALERQVLLENCIIVQAMKKGPVRHGFTLLMVPEGLYTLSASSESDKNNWVKVIRETISKQAKIGKQMIETVNNPSLGLTERSNFPGPMRSISHRDKEDQRIIPVFRTPDFRSYRRFSVTSIPLDSEGSPNPVSLSKSCEKIGFNKSDSSTDLQDTSGSANLRAKDSRAPKNQRWQAQNPGTKIKDGSLDTLSIGSTDEFTRRKFAGVDIQGRQNRKLSSVSEKSQLLIEERSSNRTPRSMSVMGSVDPPYSYPRPASRGLYLDKEPTHGISQKYPIAEVDENGDQVIYIPGTNVSGRNSTLSHVQNGKQFTNEFRGTLPRYSNSQRTDTLKNSKQELNGVHGCNVTRQITILRPQTPATNDRFKNSAAHAGEQPRAYRQLEPENKLMTQRMVVVDKPQINNTNGYNSSESNSKLQLDLFNFRQSSRRKKQSPTSGRVVTIPSSLSNHTFGANDIENALLTENHLLRERIRLLHQRNNELEKSLGRSTEKLLNTGVDGKEYSRTHQNQNGHYLGADENVLAPPVPRAAPLSTQRSAILIPNESQPAHQRVEEWLMGKSSTLPYPEDRKSFRRKLNKARRNTTEEFPTFRTVSPSPLIYDDSMALHTRRPHTRANTQTPDFGAYRKSPKIHRRVFDLADEPGLAKSNGDMRSQTPVTNKVSTFAVTDAAHPKYSSTMWCRLVELWSTLLNEERTFWRLQLENVLLQDVSHHQYDSSVPFNFNALLEKVNEKHSAETVMLWKHVYENWVPHEYMEYLTEEIRKGFTCLHSVIDALLSAFETLGHEGESTESRLENVLSSIRKEVKKIGFFSQKNGFLTDPDEAELRSKSCSMLGQKQPSSASSRVSQLSAEDWRRNRVLLRESHAQLLEQVYTVAELVGAALDTDMEDAMNAARDDSTGMAVNPLRSIPGSGLHVAAKLQSIVLDLEARLAATELYSQNKIEDNNQNDNKDSKVVEKNGTRSYSIQIQQDRDKQIPSHWSLNGSRHFDCMQ